MSGARRRTNTTRACERCRLHKRRCSGERPHCALCLRLEVPCVYTEEADGRRRHGTANPDSIGLGSDQGDLGDLEQDGRDITQLPPIEPFHADSQSPFETGRLSLDSTGNLHLTPLATFYRPIQAAIDPQAHNGPRNSRPFAASHLPFAMLESHHSEVLTLGLDVVAAFGGNYFKDRFFVAMNADPSVAGLWYSPFLHLVLLAIGMRYTVKTPDTMMPRSDPSIAYRSQPFAQKAREMMLSEMDNPQLSTIRALALFAVYALGMSEESLSRSCVAMSVFHAQNFRLHRTCDVQLRENGWEVDGEVDVVRRDVFGYIENLQCWYQTYFGQSPHTWAPQANQRAPFEYPADVTDPLKREISIMASKSVGLSGLAHRIMECNHFKREERSERTVQVRALDLELIAWRDSLPPELAWPPNTARHRPLLSSTAVMYGVYNSHVILLFRPYIVDMGTGSYFLPMASERCSSAAHTIVDLCRYIEAHHGLNSASLTLQHVLYIAGTMLFMEISGMPVALEGGYSKAWLDMLYVVDCLDRFAHIWPVARQAADWLRALLVDCCPPRQLETPGDVQL